MGLQKQGFCSKIKSRFIGGLYKQNPKDNATFYYMPLFFSKQIILYIKIIQVLCTSNVEVCVYVLNNAAILLKQKAFLSRSAQQNSSFVHTLNTMVAAKLQLCNIAIWFVKFSSEGHKIRYPISLYSFRRYYSSLKMENVKIFIQFPHNGNFLLQKLNGCCRNY